MKNICRRLFIGTVIFATALPLFAGKEKTEEQLIADLNSPKDKVVYAALQDLEKNAAAHTVKTNETLQKLCQNFEKAARDNAGSLLASAGSQMTRMLQERAAEVSREFSKGLESYTRNYLESIGKSIADLPQNMPGRSGR